MPEAPTTPGDVTSPAAMYLVMSTFPDEAAARQVARTFVEEQLAACVNVLPGVTSIYRWEGQIETNAEVGIIIKTAAPTERVMARLKELHSYQVPEIIVLPVADVLPAYLQWVRTETGAV
jgi:periplasmic divalent cation tolerance protein